MKRPGDIIPSYRAHGGHDHRTFSRGSPPATPPRKSVCQSWLPDGHSQISRQYVFGPLGLKDYGSAMLQNLIPSFPWIAPPPCLPPRRNPRKGKDRIKYCRLATLLSVNLSITGLGSMMNYADRARAALAGRAGLRGINYPPPPPLPLLPPLGPPPRPPTLRLPPPKRTPTKNLAGGGGGGGDPLSPRRRRRRPPKCRCSGCCIVRRLCRTPSGPCLFPAPASSSSWQRPSRHPTPPGTTRTTAASPRSEEACLRIGKWHVRVITENGED